MEWVRVQILMRPEHRTKASVESAAKAAAALGLAPSGQGSATFSARVSAPDYLRLFGRRFGSSPPTNLPVPKELAEYVESVTVAPQHEYF
jgi:hypothetical protein